MGCALVVAVALANPTLTVQKGDTTYGLGKRYTTSWLELERLNPGLSEALQVGQTLRLPPGAQYVVQEGDDLASIAERHGLDVMDLMIANDFVTQVRAGDRLNLSPAAPRAGTYEVRRGDTLYSLARLLGTSVDALRAANLLDSDALEVGMVLLVPGAERVEAAPVAAPAATPTSMVAGTATGRSTGTVTGTTVATSTGATAGTAAGMTAGTAASTVTVAPGDTLWSLAQRHGVSVQDLQLQNGLPDANLEVGMVLTIPLDSAVGGPAGRTVTVQAGDTLHSLALQHNTSVLQIMESNNLRTANLKVGQRLTIDPRRPGTPAAAPAPLLWPLQGIITSPFGYRTLSGVGRHHHYGLDIAAPTGTPVRAAASGLVLHAGWMGNYGNLVIIRGEGADYYYAHHSQLLVQQGDRVTAGDVIARVGSTGFSTGPHLHFEVRIGGKPVDPLSVLPAAPR